MTSRSTDIPRSVLFIPGSNADQVASATESAADLVVLDLEHANDSFSDGPVGQRVADALVDPPENAPALGVRVHGLDTTQGAVDLNCIRSAREQPKFVVIPDVKGPEELKLAEELIADTDIDILALIEAPTGVYEARGIAAATPRVTAVAFGPGDFTSYMGIPDGMTPDLSVPRYLVSMAANATDRIAIDMPNIDDMDNDALTKREAEQALSMGYDAKIGVAESQIQVINEVFDSA